MNKQKVVVTGGRGFLGAHLVEGLLECGYEVHFIDVTARGGAEGRRVSSGAHKHEIDIRDATALDAVFTALSPIAGVFHTAALPRVQFSIDSPEESHDTNVNGTLILLLACRNPKIGKFIFSASSSAYGDQENMPLSEDMLPQPKSPYALHKYIGEHYCRIFTAVYGLPTVSLRYFNIYGPGFDPHGPYAQAIGKFLHQRKAGKPLTITGDGEQTRDCVHVRDVVRANILAFENPHVGGGEVINIGSGNAPSINEIARMIGGDIVHIEPRIEPRHTRADISKAKNLLGWEPTISLEDGIAELKQLAGLV
jgi:UDP-glucose 4-epimerase